MTPKTRTRNAAFSVTLFFGLSLFCGCHHGDGASSIRSRLKSAAASGATTFDFAEDPEFEWDRMYVFGCYSPRDYVEQALGFKWPDFEETTIESSDSVVLVVFVRDDHVAAWYEQHRSIDLGWIANETGYSRNKAQFAFERAGGRIELKPNTQEVAL